MKFSSIELPNQSLGVKLEKVWNRWNDKVSADATITILAIKKEKRLTEEIIMKIFNA